ncbi:hypothetical protein HDA32_003352 [Spinactinospora alkalitolerans]|uniref:DUF3040 domain-containing protein n=1 Tax=Spinactinospora alkalitolerans TaxID=687207 RepID=A0A852TYZ8_9ACTN|nr:DUF3040 domain-containing protein [Spinactinospora alkalitolerans]NYE48232.1 hypothetical protein [Spinactinospora alkalitolerans]
MPLSRYDRERLREIEARLSADDPELARHLTRADLGDSGPPAAEPVPKGAVVTICAAVIVAGLLLVLATALGERTPGEVPSGSEPSADASLTPERGEGERSYTRSWEPRPSEFQPPEVLDRIEENEADSEETS